MFAKLARYFFYIIPGILGFLWGLANDFFTKDFFLSVWNWFISGDGGIFANMFFNSLEIVSYFFAVEAAIALIRLRHDKKIAKELVYIKVRLTREDSKLDNEKRSEKDFKEKVLVMQQLYRALYEIGDINIGNQFLTAIWQDDFVSFEMFLENKEVHFYVVTKQKYQDVIEKQIGSFYPNANFFIENKPYKFRKRGNKVGGYYFNIIEPFWHNIKMPDKMENDPLNDIVNTFSKVEEDETAVYQVIVHPLAMSERQKEAERQTKAFFSKKTVKIKIFSGVPVIGWIWNIFKVLVSPSSTGRGNMAPGAFSGDAYVRMLKTKEDHANDMGIKAGDFGFGTSIRFLVSSKTRKRNAELLRSFIVTMTIFKEDFGNQFDGSRIIIIEWLNAILMYIGFQLRLKNFFIKTSILCSKELAGVFHFPDVKYNRISVIKWMKYKILPPPSDMAKSGTLLGYNHYRGIKTPVYISTKDRSRHFYIIGKSGSGKSVMISYQARQDAQNGAGFGIIDPHGDLIEDVLGYIPKHRVKDVIVFDPADTERPMGLNVLEAHTSEEKDRASLDAMEIFIKLFGDEIFGARIQHYFRNAALTLMDDEEDGATLIDVPRMFTDDEFQARKVAKCQNAVVKSFWEGEIAHTGDREKQEMIPYFSSKFGPFITNMTIRNIIGQTKSAFNIRQIMDEEKILLVNLSKGKIGNTNAQLLGLILVNKVAQAAMSRADMLEKDRKPFYLYVDEFQNFATDTFAEILSEARKYKLALIMAHQYIAQLKEGGKQGESKIKDAVFGNVGTMMSFKLGAEDAEYFEKEYAPDLSAQDILGIANFKTYCKLNINNATSRPFSMSTIWDPSGNAKIAEICKKYSRIKYGRKKEFVDEEIEEKLKVRKK
ncbi:type IV secretory system conjugative DNA transfer family protein [Candidatus Gracilibacteria bacterium]|nr:type IV secretory system conjugative DNA transfer family protein [Candidatus Gracilibacteria bacterium]